MATWNPVQTDFTNGEVSSRMAMRVQTEEYGKSLLRMVNFMPNPQGSAERVPGTRFLLDTEAEDFQGRILQFDDSSERMVLALFRNNSIVVFPEFESSPPEITYVKADGITSEVNAVQNHTFNDRGKDWFSAWEGNGNQEVKPGANIFFQPGRAGINAMIEPHRQSNPKFEKIWQDVEVETETAVAKLIINGNYVTDYAPATPGRLEDDAIGVQITLRDPITDARIWQSDIIYLGPVAGDTGKIQVATSVALPASDFTGTLRLQIETIYNYGDKIERAALRGRYFIDDIALIVNGAPLINDPAHVVQEDPAEPVLYPSEHLQDLQFVRSPYGDKEVVITHPNHPPARLYSDREDGGIFKIGRIKFRIAQVDPDGDAVDPPDEDYVPLQWLEAEGCYPGSCTAYQGRLVLGGGGINSEEIICSVSGEWDNLFDIRDSAGRPDPASVFPDSALRFTTTYRSPIQWVVGQKDLIAGCEDIEYKIMAQQALLRPGDIDARVQTSHGTTPVQPVSMANEVMFTSERGRILRSFKSVGGQSRGEYTAMDLNILHPEISESGIRRMVRIRNPHQLVMCVLNNGEVAMLHYEPELNMAAWSRMVTQGDYRDVVVIRDRRSSLDVPVFLVERTVKGVKKLFIESMPGWSDGRVWRYSDSYINYADEPGNRFAGLKHLIGQQVAVFGDNYVIGNFEVQPEYEEGEPEEPSNIIDGFVELVDGYGEPINVSVAHIGLAKWCEMETMPAIFDSGATGGPSAKKRYSSVGVRLRASKMPLINDIRPPTKMTGSRFAQNRLPSIEEDLLDVEIAQLGYDSLETITVGEVDPIRVEVLGIYGTLTSNKV